MGEFYQKIKKFFETGTWTDNKEKSYVINFAFGKIVKRGDKWFVFDKEGKKRLGGPYDTRKEALKRLRQIEHFKRR